MTIHLCQVQACIVTLIGCDAVTFSEVQLDGQADCIRRKCACD